MLNADLTTGDCNGHAVAALRGEPGPAPGAVRGTPAYGGAGPHLLLPFIQSRGRYQGPTSGIWDQSARIPRWERPAAELPSGVH
jgi:hypothetical protein